MTAARAGGWLLWLTWLWAGAAGAAAACNGEGVALQILGSGDASLSARRAGSGALVWIDGKARVLVNAGGGVALRLQESGAQWNDLDALLFTRIDAAHGADLAALLQAAQAGGRARALPVYGPAGNKFAPSTVTFVRDLFDPVRGVYRHLGNLLAPLDRSRYKLEPHDVREPPAKLAAPRRKGPVLLPVMKNERLDLQAVPQPPDTAPRLAWRIEAAGRGIAFDSGTVDNLAIAADGAALLVAPVPPGGGDGRAEIVRQPVTELAQLAQRARVRQLLLTGRGLPSALTDDELLAAARKPFTGTVTLADDLGCYRP